MEQKTYLALDLGGTRFRVAAFSGDQLIARSSYATQAARGFDAVLEDIVAGLQSLIEKTGTATAIGVAAPGPIDPWTGVLHSPPNLPGWMDVRVKDILEHRLGIPVFPGNDANLAAIGEALFGAGRGHRSVCYFTISTGVGGGIVENGALVLGAHGYAGEFGHQTIVPDGPLCPCGCPGHLEALVSGTSLARIARERLRAGAVSSIPDFADGDIAKVNAEAIAEAARGGDRLARELFDDLARYLAIGVANVVHHLDPDLVVLGGGVMRAADLFLELVRTQVEGHLMPGMRGGVRIEPSALGDDSGLWGAFAVARLGAPVPS